jgi:hypothetical protein
MPEILGVWVIDKDGQILFSQEMFPQGEPQTNISLFSGLIVTIQKFIQELGEKDAERIEMGTDKIFISKDRATEIIFIIKTTQKANNRKITKLVSKIQKDFLKSFSPYLDKYSPKELQLYISNIFKSYIDKLLETPLKERMDKFFGKT